MAPKRLDKQLNARKRREINGSILLVIGLFLAVTYFIPGTRTGVLGKIFFDFGKGMLGQLAFLLPLLLIYMALDFFVEKRLSRTTHRITHAMILLLIVASFNQIFQIDFELMKSLSLNPQGKSSALTVLRALWLGSINPDLVKGLTVPCGGLLGGLIGLGLQSLLGQVGAILLLILATLVECILLVNLSLSDLVDRLSQFLKRSAQKTQAHLQQQAMERQARQEQQKTPLPKRSRVALEREQLRAEVLRTTSPPASTQSPSDFYDLEVGQDALATAYQERSQASLSEELGIQPNAWADLSNQNFGLAQTRKIPDGMGGFLSVGEEDLDGTVRSSSEAMGILSRYPEWNAQSALDVTDQSGFETVQLASYDAGGQQHQLNLLGEEENEEEFKIPDFLKESMVERAPAEQMEEELDRILQDSLQEDLIELSTPEETQSIRQIEGLNFASNLVDETLENEETSEQAVPATPSRPSLAGTRKQDVRVIKKEELHEGTAKPYQLPPVTLLQRSEGGNASRRDREIQAMAKRLEETFRSFSIDAKLVNITSGPSITRFELAPGVGVKVSRIVNMKDDIALSLAAVGVRIEAPIAGKSLVGIEIPNKVTTPVSLRALIDSPDFRESKPLLTAALGRDIAGAPILLDIADMPHLLIAGATGSGKSVCINAILLSLLYRAKPDELKLIMIDPKVVELSIYNGIPHLLAPVVTDPRQAANTLNWAQLEMSRRYKLLAEHSVRNFKAYNELAERQGLEKLPMIVVVIDELADLMATAKNEVEGAIARLTALARAAGIHLIIATQRPSVDVITGVIKANIPKRIAFAVSSQVDSRTIIDTGGAEQLLGKGDMLYPCRESSKPSRGQGAFVSNQEVEAVVSFCAAQAITGYDESLAEDIVSTQSASGTSQESSQTQQDELFDAAVEIILDSGIASVSILQRRLNVGHPRAGRLVDALEQSGIVGPSEGSKPRKILINRSQWEERKLLRED